VKRIGVVLVMTLGMLAMPRPGSAQPPRWMLAGAIDYTRLTEDESFLGAGVGASGSVGWRLTEATGIEVEAGLTRHVRDLHFVAVAHDGGGRIQPVPYTERWQGTATFLTASLSHSFGSGRARPMLWGGGGFMWHGGTRRGPVAAPQVPAGLVLQPGDAQTREGAGSRGLAADGGFGVDVRVARRLTLRPFAGLRVVNTGEVGPKYIVRTGIRVGFQ